MEPQEIILLIFLIAIPSIAFVVLLFNANKAPEIENDINYKYIFLGSQIILKKSSIKKLIPLVAIFFYLDFFIPFFHIIALVYFASVLFLKSGLQKIETKDISSNTQDILVQIKELDEKVQLVKSHFELMRNDLEIKQSELSAKEQTKQELIKDIKEKEAESKIWDSMNDEQRNLVSNSAVSGIAKKSKGNFWTGIILGFILNILATLTWTLFGNPGKEDILKKFEWISNLIS